MINNFNNQQIFFGGAAGQHVSLGNGALDLIVDNSAGASTIAMGQGAGNQAIDASIGGHDTIFLGNGAEDFGDAGSAGGADHIALGNGAGDEAVAQSALGGDIITLGNGDGDLVFGFSAGARDTLTLGHGVGDVAALGTGEVGFYGEVGPDTVTFNGPGAFLVLELAGNSFATPPSGAVASTAALDVIHGLVSGEQIGIGTSDTLAPTVAANLDGVAGEAVFAAGTFSASAQTFTVSASGHDAMLTYDDGSGFASVVLVGAAHEIAGASLGSGTISLG